MERCGGLILCGGRSSRMGWDKGSLLLPTGTTLQRALENLGQVAAPLVVSLAAGAAAPGLPAGVTAVQDPEKERGPLWGLLAGFRALAGKAESVLVMPVDMPFYTPPWMERLVEGLAGHRACLFRWEGFTNALTGCYRLELLPKLEGLVAEGRARPMFLIENEPTRVITVEDLWREGEGPPPLMDMDTPEDYRAALVFEGVGRAGGGPVTVEVAGGLAPGGQALEIPLAATHGDDVVAALERLRAEWGRALRGGEAVLLVEGAQGAWAPPSDALAPGARLRLQPAPGAA